MAVSFTPGGPGGKVNEIKKNNRNFWLCPPSKAIWALFVRFKCRLLGLWTDRLSRWAGRTVTVTVFKGSEGVIGDV